MQGFLTRESLLRPRNLLRSVPGSIHFEAPPTLFLRTRYKKLTSRPLRSRKAYANCKTFFLKPLNSDSVFGNCRSRRQEALTVVGARRCKETGIFTMFATEAIFRTPLCAISASATLKVSFCLLQIPCPLPLRRNSSACPQCEYSCPLVA